ncbi:GNAT family N-acetyltransferase [Pasteurellaceae bacterium HPA106]|uniref:GNAT family N-acetyltransferase n=1 Tax=Spirabiliibacterium pneumoniae TaxID=221400 RepID=UPI001AAD9D58|nr:GNAT family N-acetyltransferase [Spirabiliibacterium pneumoniae]MBE2895989.1 GNAT family N-acetyltransferase [Spirabiliibacterium pneumoniae]
MEYRLRLMTLSDYDAVTALWAATPGMGMSEQDDSPEGIARFLAHNPDLSFVAVDGDAIIGVLLCGFDGRRATLYHMAVAQAYQRQGVGQTLLARLERELRAKNVTMARLLVFADNESGNRFWQKCGWYHWRELNYYVKTLC